MSRTSVAALLLTASAALLAAGCGDKAAETSTATPAAPAAGGASAAPAQPERRVTTGADPDKAPPYPGMYGAPAGSK